MPRYSHKKSHRGAHRGRVTDPMRQTASPEKNGHSSDPENRIEFESLRTSHRLFGPFFNSPLISTSQALTDAFHMPRFANYIESIDMPHTDDLLELVGDAIKAEATSGVILGEYRLLLTQAIMGKLANIDISSDASDPEISEILNRAEQEIDPALHELFAEHIVGALGDLKADVTRKVSGASLLYKGRAPRVRVSDVFRTLYELRLDQLMKLEAETRAELDITSVDEVDENGQQLKRYILSVGEVANKAKPKLRELQRVLGQMNGDFVGWFIGSDLPDLLRPTVMPTDNDIASAVDRYVQATLDGLKETMRIHVDYFVDHADEIREMIRDYADAPVVESFTQGDVFSTDETVSSTQEKAHVDKLEVREELTSSAIHGVKVRLPWISKVESVPKTLVRYVSRDGRCVYLMSAIEGRPLKEFATSGEEVVKSLGGDFNEVVTGIVKKHFAGSRFVGASAKKMNGVAEETPYDDFVLLVDGQQGSGSRVYFTRTVAEACIDPKSIVDFRLKGAQIIIIVAKTDKHRQKPVLHILNGTNTQAAGSV